MKKSQAATAGDVALRRADREINLYICKEREGSSIYVREARAPPFVFGGRRKKIRHPSVRRGRDGDAPLVAAPRGERRSAKRSTPAARLRQYLRNSLSVNAALRLHYFTAPKLEVQTLFLPRRHCRVPRKIKFNTASARKQCKVVVPSKFELVLNCRVQGSHNKLSLETLCAGSTVNLSFTAHRRPNRC